MDLVFEQQYWGNHTLVVGVDEVGRGCLAGPVVVGAVVFPINQRLILGVNDSKRLSAKKRELLAPLIRKQALAVGVGQIEADVIDQMGIVTAILQAADKAIKMMKLDKKYMVVSDGPNPIHSSIPEVGLEAIIDGDAKIYTISAASIVAKVYRDELMHQCAKKYPGYGWETNVGYGTKQHLEAIKNLGLTPLHRRSFC